MKILDTHNEFNYTYYEACDKLKSEYDRMYGIIKANGHALMSDSWSLDAGILLENDTTVIAGAFFNLSKSPSSILIHIVFVDEVYRQQGIYKKMHSLIDLIGNELNRHNVYSYIHSKNEIMQDYVAKSIGYETVMQLVSRKIKEN
jgi:RimJ/RimL family protein N-acetyltransferase